MTPSTKHAIEDCLRTTSSHDVVFCPELFQGTFPTYLTATCLRVIADSMDEFNKAPKDCVRVNTLRELGEMKEQIPKGWPPAHEENQK